jgi:hypothetical protein
VHPRALPVELRVLIMNKYMWKQWVNAIAGLAVIAAPFMALSATALMWTLVVAGLIIAVLSLWSAMENPADYREYRVQHT